MRKGEGGGGERTTCVEGCMYMYIHNVLYMYKCITIMQWMYTCTSFLMWCFSTNHCQEGNRTIHVYT